MCATQITNWLLKTEIAGCQLKITEEGWDEDRLYFHRLFTAACENMRGAPSSGLRSPAGNDLALTRAFTDPHLPPCHACIGWTWVCLLTTKLLQRMCHRCHDCQAPVAAAATASREMPSGNIRLGRRVGTRTQVTCRLMFAKASIQLWHL